MILKLLFCHLIGDYVLQSDFIAKTKGNNWYHLVVHSLLYCFPLYVLFGLDLRIIFILFTHIITDMLKARFNKITYFQDQLMHYMFLMVYLF